MNLVARFESFIERLMERSFTRAAHSKLQPVEIGKRLVRAMESQQQVGVGGILVPNVYDVYLSRLDYAQFQPARRSMTTNLEVHLSRVARQHPKASALGPLSDCFGKGQQDNRTGAR